LKKILFLLPFLFTSCYFQDFNGIKKNNLNERVFENSVQTIILNKNGESQADLKIVYISDISSKFNNKSDVFLLSVYFFDKKIDGLKQVRYSLTLNGIRPYKIEKINPKSRIISQIKLLNPWFSNYIVYFKKINTNKFTISFRYNYFTPVKLKIIKGRGELRDYPTVINIIHN